MGRCDKGAAKCSYVSFPFYFQMVGNKFEFDISAGRKVKSRKVLGHLIPVARVRCIWVYNLDQQPHRELCGEIRRDEFNKAMRIGWHIVFEKCVAFVVIADPIAVCRKMAY